MSYDKAKYHFDSVIEEDLPLSQAYIHTGFYLGWLIDNNLLDEEFKEDLAESLALFTRREITAPQLFEEFDGTLTDEELSTQGNAFTKHYFDFDTGDYLEDYCTHLVKDLPSEFHVKDTWENYKIAASFISRRYQEWLQNQ
ncbi:hypothetical protein ILY73_004037 [Escherichia coli]|nr:hypothetical protein [Escherichia coli]